MRILKKGITPEEVMYKGKCLNCKCEFIFSMAESNGHYHSAKNESYIKIDCPSCKKEIYHDIICNPALNETEKLSHFIQD